MSVLLELLELSISEGLLLRKASCSTFLLPFTAHRASALCRTHVSAQALLNHLGFIDTKKQRRIMHIFCITVPIAVKVNIKGSRVSENGVLAYFANQPSENDFLSFYVLRPARKCSFCKSPLVFWVNPGLPVLYSVVVDASCNLYGMWFICAVTRKC